MEPIRKEKFGRLVQSLWILMTIIPFTNCIGFFYIGIRARSRRWALWGLLYMLPSIGMFSTAFSSDSWGFNVILICFIIGSLSSIIHGFSIRKQYSRRLEALQELRSGAAEHSQTKIELEVGVSTPLPSVEPRILQTPTTSIPQTTSVVVLDLNSATEQEIAALPGIGITLGKKAVTYRHSRSGFYSFDEFVELLSLSPHIVERLRPLITVIPASPPPPRLGGRMVDY